MRTGKVVAGLAALAVLAVGCSGDGDDKPGQPDASQPRQGGTLRVAVVGASSLDPAQARSVDQLLVADQLFDGLTAQRGPEAEVAPAVAESWTASPDQKTWDFKLRGDARFTNARPITAADVKFTLERIARRGSGSPAADLLELINGFRAFNVDGTAPGLAGVQELAPDVVRIVLDQPQSVLPSVLANPSFGIVPRESVEAQPPAPAFADQPVGSGPFAVTERSADAIRLVRADGAQTRLDGLELRLFDDADAAYRAFVAGEADYATVPADQIAAAGKRFGREHFRPYLAELFYGFNLKNPKYADPRFRLAILKAVDRRGIVSAIYGSTVLELESLVVQGVAGHQDDACGGRCEHDPEGARRLVAEAFPQGGVPEVQVDYDDDPTQEAVAKAIEANLEAVGIPAALRPKALREYQDFAVSGQQELFRLGWIGAYASPDAFLPALFSSSSPNNLTGFSLPAVDLQLAAARAEPDAAARIERFRAAERAILEQVPIVPIAQFKIHAVVSKRVRDLEVTVAGSFDATRVWLASGAR